MASVTPEANPGTCYAHWHPMEKGCVQRGEGGEGWQGCFTSGEKKPADPLLPSPGSVLGENGQETGVGDQATEDMLNQHISQEL